MGIFRNKPKITDGLTAAEQELVSQYTSCFTGPAGDFVVEDLFILCGMATSVFNDADYDPVRAAHRDGMQTVLKRILNCSGRSIYK
jgi:hypothetical protein